MADDPWEALRRLQQQAALTAPSLPYWGTSTMLPGSVTLWGASGVGGAGQWQSAGPALVPLPRQLPRLDMKESISVQVTLNTDYQLHSIGTDPAVVYADGRKEFYVKGVRVPEFVVTQPHRIKVDDINKEVNVEVRRIMLERYGLAKYLQNSKAEMIDQDEFGKLWRVAVPGDEPLVMVEVVNSTAEPDGTFKSY